MYLFFDDVDERERRRIFWYSSDAIEMVKKEHNYPHKKDKTNYSNMRTNALTCKNTEDMKYKATATMKWKEHN